MAEGDLTQISDEARRRWDKVWPPVVCESCDAFTAMFILDEGGEDETLLCNICACKEKSIDVSRGVPTPKEISGSGHGGTPRVWSEKPKRRARKPVY